MSAPQSSRALVLGVLALLGVALAFATYVGVGAFLRARDDAPSAGSPSAGQPTPSPSPATTSPAAPRPRTEPASTIEPRDARAAASLDELETRANAAMDRAEARWATIRADAREGRLTIDAAVAAFQKECSTPLEAISTELSPPGADPRADDALRRERIRARVVTMLLTMDREALTLVEGEQQRATDAMEALGKAAAREREELRKLREAKEAREAAMGDSMGDGGSGAK